LWIDKNNQLRVEFENHWLPEVQRALLAAKNELKITKSSSTPIVAIIPCILEIFTLLEFVGKNSDRFPRMGGSDKTRLGINNIKPKEFEIICRYNEIVFFELSRYFVNGMNLISYDIGRLPKIAKVELYTLLQDSFLGPIIKDELDFDLILEKKLESAPKKIGNKKNQRTVFVILKDKVILNQDNFKDPEVTVKEMLDKLRKELIRLEFISHVSTKSFVSIFTGEMNNGRAKIHWVAKPNTLYYFLKTIRQLCEGPPDNFLQIGEEYFTINLPNNRSFSSSLKSSKDPSRLNKKRLDNILKTSFPEARLIFPE
jgi:hypothetical protein